MGRCDGPFAALFLFCVSCAVAGGETLHGRILDRATLSATGAATGVTGARLVVYDSTGRKVAAKAAARSGAYSIPRLAPGAYTLSIAAKGFQPSPLLRLIAIGSEDTASRDFTLDKLPMRAGAPVRAGAPAKAKGKAKIAAPYYPQLALGMIESMHRPSVQREALTGAFTLSRCFDAEDTTQAYRGLWAPLLWAEIEGQDRPVESRVYLAQAYDSALRAAGIPVPAALKPWLKADADSVEALALSLRGLILSPGKQDPAEAVSKRGIPRTVLARMLEEALRSGLPKAKKKTFVTKIKKIIGPDVARDWMAWIDPPRVKNAAKGKEAAPAGPPRPDLAAAWKVVADAAAGTSPNPLALFVVAQRQGESGKTREAAALYERLRSLRPEDPKVINALALVRFALGDTAAAAALFDSLTQSESPDWQARGFRAMANLHWRAGRAEKAEAALWRALGLDGQSRAARGDVLFLAQVSLARGTWTPVEALLDSLVTLRPKEAEAHYWLGRMALKRQQDGVALDRFRRAVALAPSRPEFAEALASAYYSREECVPALAALAPVKARLSGEGLSIYGYCLQQQGRAQAAVSEFARLNAARPSAENLAAYARALTAAKRAREAVAAIQASKYAGEPVARKALAEADLALGQGGQARQALSGLNAPEDPESHYLLGQAAYALREYPQAGEELTLALRYREDYPDAKYLQGQCLLKQGRSGEAHHYFQELMDDPKGSWRAKGLLGQGQAFAKEDKPEAAEENLRRSFQAVPGAEAAANLALALLKENKNGEAAEWAAKARKLDPDEPLALMAAVDALLADQKMDAALALANQGLEAHPEACDFLVVAAKARLRAGQDAEAAELSRKANGLCPEEAAPYYYLGTLSARAGTMKEARRLFSEYLRTGGDAKRVPVAYR